jgi:DNA-binding transcriptional ArsR family regulator
MTYLSAFAALSDPTRREVFERLHRAPASVNEIAEGLPVTRPAVSQHLKALMLAGLIAARTEGTRRVYMVEPEGLKELRLWLEQFWRALDAFEKEIEEPLAAKRRALFRLTTRPSLGPEKISSPLRPHHALSKSVKNRGIFHE